MCKLVILIVALVVGYALVSSAKLEEVFKWKEVSYTWPSKEVENNAIASGEYILENNMPVGLVRWKDKMFVTVPRWKAGVAATLTYIPLNNSSNHSPALIPYPDWESHKLPKADETAKENTLVSIFRLDVDACDRLWAIDTGLSGILYEGRQITPPTILVWDLKTDKLIKRYPLKSEDITCGSFFANIIVDVTPDQCDKAYAYLPDLGGYGVVVYSLADNDSWRVKHNYFNFDPLKGDLTIGGTNFQWNDGVFAVALGNVQSDGHRTAYFHPLISEYKFSVNTRIWKNKTLALSSSSYHEYKFEGTKGDKSQTSASAFDAISEVVFFAQLQKDGVACWNTKKQLSPENVSMVAENHEKIVFPNDIKVDEDRNLWILSDKLPQFVDGTLNHNHINYRIMKISVKSAISNTHCA